jgi:hypothetical protein
LPSCGGIIGLWYSVLDFPRPIQVVRSHEESAWDLDLLTPELSELTELDFDLGLTGFDGAEIDRLLGLPIDDEQANAVPPVPEVATSQPGDLWLCGPHRVLCGDCTSPENVARVRDGSKPFLMVTDLPYGIELDSEWRDRAGLNGCGPAESSYMKDRTKGHTNTSISSDTRADWSDAFSLAPSLQVAYVWHASKFTREVLDGLLRIGSPPPADHLGQGPHGPNPHPLLVPARSPRGMSARRTLPGSARPARIRPSGTRRHRSSSWVTRRKKSSIILPKKPLELMRRSIVNHILPADLVYEPFA